MKKHKIFICINPIYKNLIQFNSQKELEFKIIIIFKMNIFSGHNLSSWRYNKNLQMQFTFKMNHF